MNDNSTTNTAAQPDEAASDRTPIYNAVAKLRDAVTQLCGGDVATMEFFEQNARIIITGAAYIADTRDAVIKELFKEAHNKEVQLDTDSGADYKREYINEWVAAELNGAPSKVIDKYQEKIAAYKQVWPSEF